MRTMTGDTNPAPVAYSSRWEERNARRMESKRLAEEASRARGARNHKTLTQRVEIAKDRLKGSNVSTAIQLIQQVSSSDYDIYIIAEEQGENRRGVLKQFGPPRNSVRTAYLAEAGLASPEDAPMGEE
jgi:hypothetical protein